MTRRLRWPGEGTTTKSCCPTLVVGYMNNTGFGTREAFFSDDRAVFKIPKSSPVASTPGLQCPGHLRTFTETLTTSSLELFCFLDFLLWNFEELWECWVAVNRATLRRPPAEKRYYNCLCVRCKCMQHCQHWQDRLPKRWPRCSTLIWDRLFMMSDCMTRDSRVSASLGLWSCLSAPEYKQLHRTSYLYFVFLMPCHDPKAVRCIISSRKGMVVHLILKYIGGCEGPKTIKLTRLKFQRRSGQQRHRWHNGCGRDVPWFLFSLWLRFYLFSVFFFVCFFWLLVSATQQWGQPAHDLTPFVFFFSLFSKSLTSRQVTAGPHGDKQPGAILISELQGCWSPNEPHQHHHHHHSPLTGLSYRSNKQAVFCFLLLNVHSDVRVRRETFLGGKKNSTGAAALSSWSSRPLQPTRIKTKPRLLLLKLINQMGQTYSWQSVCKEIFRNICLSYKFTNLFSSADSETRMVSVAIHFLLGWVITLLTMKQLMIHFPWTECLILY